MNFLFSEVESAEYAEITPHLKKCKRLSSTIRSRRSFNRRSNSFSISFESNLPSRTTCGKLVQLYLRTFEMVFRILHVPSFEKDYEVFWNHPLDFNSCFSRKLLLVMAIGTSLYRETKEQESLLRSLASKWIYETQQWLIQMLEISELDFDGLQISCLLLLARQTDIVGTDLVWISADFPLRIAISMGLHKEPSVHFPKMAIQEAEIRRRLWSTILEISIQSCLDSGMPPSISGEDFDCLLPSNLDDSQIVENVSASLLNSDPSLEESFTQSSILILLSRTARTRLRIIQTLNSLKTNLNYQETLKLGSELEAACRANASLVQSYMLPASPGNKTYRTKPSEFQIKLLEILTRRFLLALHGPFANKAKSDPMFYFSRKVVAENAFLILAHPSAKHQGNNIHYNDDDYSRLQLSGGGIFEHALWHATATICAELINDLNDDSFSYANSSSRKNLYDAIKDSIEILGRRIKAEGTSVEAYVLFSCALAQIDAIQSSKDQVKSIVDAANSGLVFCCRGLEAIAGEEGQSIQFGSLRTNFSQKDMGFPGGEGILGSQDTMVSFEDGQDRFRF